MTRAISILAALTFWTGCGPELGGELGEAEQALSSTKLVVWQHNTSGLNSGFAYAFDTYADDPDVLVLNEAGDVNAVCGSGYRLNAASRCVDPYGNLGAAPNSVMGAIFAEDPSGDWRVATQATTIIWRGTRLSRIGPKLTWGSVADPSTVSWQVETVCSTVLNGRRGYPAVFLRDTRTTATDTADDRLLVFTSGHWFDGRDCGNLSLRHFEAFWKAYASWSVDGASAGDKYDLVYVGGDFNQNAGTSVSTYSETPEAQWHANYRTPGVWTADGRTDLVQKTYGTALPPASFNSYSPCWGASNGSDVCRPDHAFGHIREGSTVTHGSSSVLTSGGSQNPNGGYGYFGSDHRAIRSVFNY